MLATTSPPFSPWANLYCGLYCRWGNIRWAKYSGFSTIKVFTEILSRCLGHKCSLFSTIKEREALIFTEKLWW